MNLKRTFAVAAIGGALTLGLAACGSSPEAPTPTELPSATVSSSASATPSTPVAEVDVTDAEQITVAPGGYFQMPEPQGWSAIMSSGKHDFKKLAYTLNFDASAVGPVEAKDTPKDMSQVSVVRAGTAAEQKSGVSLWRVASGASGTANIVVSYTDPTSGEVVKSAVVVNVK